MMYTQKELILDSVKKLLDSKEEKWLKSSIKTLNNVTWL